MKGMSQALHFGKSVHDNGWGMFTTFLEYKLKEQGKQLVKIDKWFPSTKKCSCCGAEKPMTLSERTINVLVVMRQIETIIQPSISKMKDYAY